MKDNHLEDTKFCKHCNVELVAGYKGEGNWNPTYKKSGHRICKSCFNKKYLVINTKGNPKNNPTRMYVNGKYISRKHPLYKAGRYKSFGDAAFSLLEKKKGVKDGYVYAIINPAWPDWVKIGMAVDAEDRLNGYQTSSPMRDYKLIDSVYSKNRSKAERNAHKLAAKIAERRGEWFNISNEQAIKVLQEVSDG